MTQTSNLDFLHVDGTIWVAYGPPLQLPGEFFFEDFFPVRNTLRPPENIMAIARIGRINDYGSSLHATTHKNVVRRRSQSLSSESP